MKKLNIGVYSITISETAAPRLCIHFAIFNLGIHSAKMNIAWEEIKDLPLSQLEDFIAKRITL